MSYPYPTTLPLLFTFAVVRSTADPFCAFISAFNCSSCSGVGPCVWGAGGTGVFSFSGSSAGGVCSCCCAWSCAMALCFALLSVGASNVALGVLLKLFTSQKNSWVTLLFSHFSMLFSVNFLSML